MDKIVEEILREQAEEQRRVDAIIERMWDRRDHPENYEHHVVAELRSEDGKVVDFNAYRRRKGMWCMY